MNNTQLIETLRHWNEKLKEAGYIPTLELLIEKLEDYEEVRGEALSDLSRGN